MTEVAFKNCAPFTKCITKTNRTSINYSEDLDLVMLMYNLLEYSSNCSDTAGSFWFYSKDLGARFNADIEDNNNFKCFKYKEKLLENTRANGANGILKN